MKNRAKNLCHGCPFFEGYYETEFGLPIIACRLSEEDTLDVSYTDKCIYQSDTIIDNLEEEKVQSFRLEVL